MEKIKKLIVSAQTIIDDLPSGPGVGQLTKIADDIEEEIKNFYEAKNGHMTKEEKDAFDWALNQKHNSVAATYARILANYIQVNAGALL